MSKSSLYRALPAARRVALIQHAITIFVPIQMNSDGPNTNFTTAVLYPIGVQIFPDKVADGTIACHGGNGRITSKVCAATKVGACFIFDNWLAAIG